MAASRDLAGRTLADALIQLRCQQSGERPTYVTLVEDGAAGTHGRMDATGWRVALAGEEGDNSPR